MYLSNTTLFHGRGIYSIYCLRYSYIFRRLTMTIFRLYTKYLVSSYTRLIMGCIQWYITGGEVGTIMIKLFCFVEYILFVIGHLKSP